MTMKDKVLGRSIEVVTQTADAALINRPYRSLADVAEIEKVPLLERLAVTNFLHRIDFALAARDPQAIAIHYIENGNVDAPADKTSFAELRQNIDTTAALLRASGVRRGDPVAILLPAVPSIYWSIIGAMKAGIAFPINWMLEPPQIAHMLREAGVRAVIALGPTPGFRIWEAMTAIRSELPHDVPIWSVGGPAGEVLHESDLDIAIAAQIETAVPDADTISSDDIAAYVHSGGTTGTPKIVKLSHLGFSYRHWTIQLSQKLILGETSLHDTPLFHVGGLIGRWLSALASGSSMVIPSVMGARDRAYIANYWKFVERFRITRLSGVPTTLAVLARNPPKGEDLTWLSPFFGTGSTALPVAVREQFQAVSGVRILNSYGMTENTSSVACDPRDGPTRDGSSGIRLPYTDVRAVTIASAHGKGQVCGPDEIGMLQVFGPGVTPGFVDPVHALSAFSEDGWLISGDLGRIDGDGCIFVTGREKDVIIRGGHNIDPALIEEPLMQLSDVVLAAAVGKPDAHAGEIPIVYVQLVRGSTLTVGDLGEHLRPRIAERAAFPSEILLTDEIPLTGVGKPMKAELKRDTAERAFSSALSARFGDTGIKLHVSVESHPKFGAITRIRIICCADERADAEATIRLVMDEYAAAYDIEWSPTA